jgi:hypothetical protein
MAEIDRLLEVVPFLRRRQVVRPQIARVVHDAVAGSGKAHVEAVRIVHRVGADLGGESLRLGRVFLQQRVLLENFEGIRRRGPHDVGRALARFADEGDGGRRIAVLHVDAGAGIFLLERLRVRRGQILRERRDDGEPVLRLLRSWLLRER